VPRWELRAPAHDLHRIDVNAAIIGTLFAKRNIIDRST
jgi:hypothetical protein